MFCALWVGCTVFLHFAKLVFEVLIIGNENDGLRCRSAGTWKEGRKSSELDYALEATVEGRYRIVRSGRCCEQRSFSSARTARWKDALKNSKLQSADIGRHLRAILQDEDLIGCYEQVHRMQSWRYADSEATGVVHR